ncbi:MAG: hypothetical protein RR942_08400 [Romboutsia sp.]
MEKEFGKLIEKLIHFSEQKNYSLAVELGYDVSYISKWINSIMVPASKNIKIICKKTANFIIESSSNSAINDMIEYFEVKIYSDDHKEKEEILKKAIENNLNKAYTFSVNKLNKKSITNKQGEDENSILCVNPSLIKKYLDTEFKTLTNEKDDIDSIVIANLFSLNKEDKIHLAAIRKGIPKKHLNKKSKIKFLVSFDENVIKDIIFDMILFINMLTNYNTQKFEMYSCKFSPYSLITVVKDKFVHSALYGDDNRCIFTNTSKNKDVVDDMYDTLENILHNKSTITFNNKSSKEIILDKNYIQYIISKEIELVMGKVNELFMPSELFLEIGKMVFGDSENVMRELNQIDTVLQNATYKSDIKVFMYEAGLRDYISTGNMSFFNTPITLTLPQRQKHIEYMEKLFSQNKNIDIKLMDGNLITDFKNNTNPSIWISKNTSFIKIEDDIDLGKYLLIKDMKLDAIFKKFFNQLWNIERNSLVNKKEDVIERIQQLLSYIKILNGDFSK